ncbi:glucosaminidase domain-containing protein [Sulfurimonas sp. C5]|uniref:glucosaminidase domain-containing protein n=1 Tax=Sulfurimonas sp. C5 TaxID=3036947 RepID=UPI002458756A|nr:glucosaminidase domain-containing protein [Sulfurimonas sp. C5]MDH4944770.1 glucosaminidase domain-containing protein [Sulfurimonas sp. C5]
MKKFFLIVTLLYLDAHADAYIKTSKNISVTEKKQRFYALVVPIIDKIYKERYNEYKKISTDLNRNKNNEKIEELKQYYKVKTNEELLMALKPQPKSITIAQAAMESAWGTSRFFLLGNNLFGMWSVSKKEQRIAAKEKRDNNTTVWVKKYSSLEDSVRGYYLTLGRGKRYQNLRELNYSSSNVFEIIKGLDGYSERGESYVDEIKSIIKYNKLMKYDKK